MSFSVWCRRHCVVRIVLVACSPNSCSVSTTPFNTYFITINLNYNKMEQYAISISYNVVLAWLATVALLLFARHFLRLTTKLNLPPGPKPWPIIGNFNLIGSLPHRSIHDLSQKYGQIMHLKFGSKSVVVGSSVEIAKVILKTMDVNFICRPKLAAGKYTTYNYSDITWSPYGPYWRQARKMCIVELFSLSCFLWLLSCLVWLSSCLV